MAYFPCHIAVVHHIYIAMQDPASSVVILLFSSTRYVPYVAGTRGSSQVQQMGYQVAYYVGETISFSNGGLSVAQLITSTSTAVLSSEAGSSIRARTTRLANRCSFLRGIIGIDTDSAVAADGCRGGVCWLIIPGREGESPTSWGAGLLSSSRVHVHARDAIDQEILIVGKAMTIAGRGRSQSWSVCGFGVI